MMCECGGPVWIKKSQECKSCYNKRYQAENPDKYNKTCACGKAMSYRAKQCKDCYVQPKKVLTPEDEEQRRVEARRKSLEKYYARNPEKRREEKRRYRASEAGKAAKRRERQKYKERYPERVRAAKALRRARLRGAKVGTLGPNYVTAVYEFYGRECLKCGAVDVLHIDHVTPLARNGRHAISNMQVLCADCNVRKSASSSADYRAGRRLINFLEWRKNVDLSNKVGFIPFN